MKQKIAIGIMLLAGLAFVIVMVIPKTGKPPRVDHNFEYPEPPFKQEGNLSFIGKDGQEISKLSIEIADNDIERSMGLMHRKSMEENKGMLFMFDRSEMQSFWMKNTHIALDIIYLDQNLEVVNIVPNCVPFSEIHILSDKPSMYVVEVIAGYCVKHNITTGDKITFQKL